MSSLICYIQGDKQGCLQDLNSWGGLRVGAFILACDIHVKKKNFWVEHHFLASFIGGLCPNWRQPWRQALELTIG